MAEDLGRVLGVMSMMGGVFALVVFMGVLCHLNDKSPVDIFSVFMGLLFLVLFIGCIGVFILRCAGVVNV